MSGVRIRATGTSVGHVATEYAAPVSRGLEAIYFLNTQVVDWSHNYAEGKGSGKVFGAPIPSAGFTTFKSLTNYIETDVSETDEMTWLVLGRSELDGTDQSSRAVFLSNYGTSQDPPGSGVYIQNTNRVSAFACYGTDVNTNAVVASSVNSTEPVTHWNLYAVIIQAGTVTMRNLTTGQTGTVASVKPRRKGPGKLRIGSSVGNYTGVCEIAMVQMHSVVLNEAEIQEAAADLRMQALRWGGINA